MCLCGSRNPITPLRASVAIPGMLPPVFQGEDGLVDGAAINSLPVDLIKVHAPGFVIGSDLAASGTRDEADIILKPKLDDVDLLNWQAFECAIEVGYEHTRQVLADSLQLPRVAAQVPAPPAQPLDSLRVAIAKREAIHH